MKPGITIRSETDADVDAITDVTIAASRPWRSAITRSNTSIHHRGATCCQSPHNISRCRIGCQSDRAYCFFSRDHFRWHAKLVRTRPRFSTPRLSTPGHWKGTYTRRIVTLEKLQSERLLPGRASKILSTIWV